MTKQVQRTNPVEILKSFLISGEKVAQKFQDNYLEILTRTHHDLPQRYLIDFINKAMITGADPRIGEVFLVKRYSSKERCNTGVTVFSFNWFMKRAEESGKYEGAQVSSSVKPYFVNGKPVDTLCSTATVFRDGREFVAEVFLPEYVQNSPIWKSKPYVMLEKCALSRAVRFAFPAYYSGIYSAEEMGEEIFEEEVTKINDSEAIEAKSKSVEPKDKKNQIVDEIKMIASAITKGMSREKKMDFIKRELEIDFLDDLEKFKKVRLEKTLLHVNNLKASSVVMG